MLQRHGWGPPVSTPSRRWPDERFDDSLPGSHPCPFGGAPPPSSTDPGDPATWYRSLVLEAPGDGAEILLEVTVNDEGGPTVDALTTAHTLRDLEALRRTLADLVPTLAALSTCRDKVRA